MSARLYITSVSGTSPFDFYVCGLDLNNCQFIGSASTANPTVIFTLPEIFSGASSIILKMIDSLSCEIFKVITCDTTCTFDVIINTAECEFCITIQSS
jgi:hypothetical protein